MKYISLRGILHLPVKTPTRIWWSWFVKIIPSDAMFSSAVARTEDSRQSQESIASNSGRGEGMMIGRREGKKS